MTSLLRLSFQLELTSAEALLQEMKQFKEGIVRQARTRVKVLAYGLGVFMVVQWGVIFHFVYEVCVCLFACSELERCLILPPSFL